VIDKTAIWNAALAKIGGFRITTPDDESPAARFLRDAWERTLRFTLAAHSWDFATRQFKLARIGASPVARYKYAYEKPSGWIRTVTVSGQEDMRWPLLEFRDIGGRILSDDTAVWMECVVWTEEIPSFSASFIECLATRLAFEVSKAITTSDQMREGLWKLYEESLRTARSQDAIGGPPKAMPISNWVRAKYGG
jgi:hypothetical protein